MQEFEEAKKCVAGKQYDYLDHRNQDFDRDFNSFIQRTDSLRENIGETIEKNFESVWETPQGIRFLTRFESVSICDLLYILFYAFDINKYFVCFI